MKSSLSGLDIGARMTMGLSHYRLYFWLCSYYAIISGIALLAMAHDKLAARAQRQRIAEFRLHLLSAAGGWPGAWLACGLFRHKIRKPRFQLQQGFAALVNIMLLAIVLKMFALIGVIS